MQEVEYLVKFITEVDQLKTVTRRIRVRDRYENPAEHSWQVSLLALSLQKYVDPSIDMMRVISMLLVHDIGEIDTGDTMVFAEVDWKERKAREEAAANRIFGFLPEAVAIKFFSLWQEFELGESDESKLANALDRAMPVLLNLENTGQSWRENSISYERVVKRVEPPVKLGFPALWQYLNERLKEARDKGYFGA